MASDYPLLANCAQRGTPIRGCALSFNDAPDLTKLKSKFNEVSTFDWSYPRAQPLGPTIYNVYMRNIDEFICSFELSRENDDLEQFKSTRLHPEFASLSDEEILKQIADLAQDRALMINYLLSSRVSPVYHQDYVDDHSPPDTEYERQELKKDRPRMAKKIVEAFWGFAHSGNPLPAHRHKQLGISSYDRWADRIDDKLTAMAERLKKDPQKMRDLNPIVIEDDDPVNEADDEADDEPKHVLEDVTNTKGGTKFTKELSSDRHTTKRRIVLPFPPNRSSTPDTEQTSEEADKMVSPKFGEFQLESPKRKDRK
ncbi:hypothetical protein F5Y00DRAFT_259533 [Daldinia vernicosa]|uniref:uncharacterized protein n=1 Tax=Daldinia vernicosa TaxID=114800 RepID=UPI002007B42C|nr:uncharacterized protein F5Y00DRAFT_259533 [Daldinia vernicosa]KAI0851531.1 hypothetical protein F5Y00DRAFT_259533 [Daldinia vernicosa]